MSLPRYFEDPQTLHVNTTPHHAYFIPFSSTESAIKKTREFSPYFTLLNGEWDFAYFESYTHLPQDFLHFLFTDKSFILSQKSAKFLNSPLLVLSFTISSTADVPTFFILPSPKRIPSLSTVNLV